MTTYAQLARKTAEQEKQRTQERDALRRAVNKVSRRTSRLDHNRKENDR